MALAVPDKTPFADYRSNMMTSLELDLDLLPGRGDGLSADDRDKIQAFVDRPHLDTWVAAANVAIAMYGSQALSLCARLLKDFPHYHQGNTYYEIPRIDGPSFWHAYPEPEHVIRVIKGLTKTDQLPSIALELDLCRSTNNKLDVDERRALERLYYRPSVKHLVAAKDIVLLEDADPDGGHLTFIRALAMVAPEWLEQAIGEEPHGDRRVKAFKSAPTWQLTQAALVRATH